ncbi:thiol-disulfide isomerase/thioredoxin [Actinobacillus equuli]|nr:thiol-disulfide isomerase/thioredoxin [Actinobacillus equuli]
MAHFYEYLEFSSDEDRENQLEVYVDVKLEAETEEKLKALGVQGDWLVMAEPYCPDCVEIVAYFQRMTKLNPNINVKYVSRKDNKERKHLTVMSSNKRSFLRKKFQVSLISVMAKLN